MIQLTLTVRVALCAFMDILLSVTSALNFLDSIHHSLMCHGAVWTANVVPSK